MRRLVLFRRLPEASEADFLAAIDGLRVLDQSMTEMDSWWVSANPGGEGKWDAALVADFADEAACRAYEVHPAHVAAASAVGPVAEFAVFDSP
jgi:hypothetical protein